MKKYIVEMAYGVNVSVVVDAENDTDAISNAVKLVENNKSEYIDLDEVGFIDPTYVKETY